MARNKDQKKELVEVYANKIKSAKAVYILEPNKLTANQANEIKMALYDFDSNYNVIKSTLFKRALEASQMDVPDHLLHNAKSVVFTGDKISETAKIINEFAKKNESVLEIKSGYIDGKPISGAEIKALADLPSREVLIAQVLSTMQAPISGFVNVLAGNIRNIVNVVNAIKDKKQ